MPKNVLFTLFVLVVVAAGLFLFFGKSPVLQRGDQSQTNDTPSDVILPDVSKDIVWNAYTLNAKVFIYPSEWTFDEMKDEAGKVIGFTIANPVSSNIHDRIDVGGTCPASEMAEYQNACVGGVWMRTDSKSELVLSVFNDMKTFGESEAAHAQQ